MTNYIMAADTVAFGFAPQDATLAAGRKLFVDPPPKYAFAPQAATLAHGRQIVAEPVAFGFAPQDATLTYGRKLFADAAVFGFAPQDATLSVGKSIAAEPVMFGWSPQDAVLARGYMLDAEPVTFACDPQDADLAVLMHTLFADAVVFTMTLGNATVLAVQAATSIEPFDLPEFDRQTAWTVDFNGLNDLIWFAGYSPNRGAFLVRYTDGGFTLWLGMPQGVMRGLMLATNQRQFLHNLGRPFLASFFP